MEYVSAKVIKVVEIDGDRIVGSYLVNRISGKRLEHKGGEFALSYFIGNGLFRKKARLDSSDMRVVYCKEDGIRLVADCGGLEFEVFISYTADGESGVLRKTLALRSSDPKVKIDYIELDGFSVEGAKFSWSIPKVKKRVFIPAYITTMGQPYYVDDMFFGGEFPVADNRIEDGFAYSRYYVGRTFEEIAEDGVYTSVPFVMGSGRSADFSSMRADFFEYISTIAVQPAKFRIQFNSWYDNMLDIDSEKIAASFTEIAQGLENAGLRPLDCYVVDDGWVDYKVPKFWDFDKNKFPDEFNRESALTKRLGSTFGVWFGPRGGYTSQTIKYARLLGGIGYPVCKQSFDICTCNPRYIADLCVRMADFCIKYNVSYFKIDGFAVTPCKAKDHGHPKGYGDGLYFYTFLWEEWTRGFERIRRARPDVFLNVTSYAHCSPWFLKWCDAIWLNNCGDMGYVGKGDNLAQCLNYRDGRYRDFFEVRQLQFPVSNLYNHEPCYAERNCNPPMTSNLQKPGAAHPTVIYDIDEFKRYMYMCMMRGTGFVELYFTPKMFDAERYKAATEVLQWAERNFDVIKRSRFFGDSPEDGGVYGYYAYRDGKGIMALRNSASDDRECTVGEDILRFEGRRHIFVPVYPQGGEVIQTDKELKIKLKAYEIRIYELREENRK